MADVSHDVQSLLSSATRDFLVRNSGDQVKIESLKGKRIGLYFSASWCPPCRKFTPTLIEVYNQVAPNGEFEVIFVTSDRDEDSFKAYLSKMPWLAVPFSDKEARFGLSKVFHVRGIPFLVLLDEDGKVVTKNGSDVIREHGVAGYPFTSARIKELKDLEEHAKMNQSLASILVSASRDFVISSHGNKVPVSELEGKTIGLYFSSKSYKSCTDFTPKLVEVYEELRAKGENFEIVTVPLDNDEESLKQGVESVPWLSLPFKDRACDRLPRYFDLKAVPSLVIIGPNGKTLHPNVAEAVEDHGVVAYPFTPQKFDELAEIHKARDAAQTLDSILVSGNQDFVIGKDGVKIPVSELVGKNILLYFSAHWCPPCRAFLPKLVDAYHKIKAQDNEFEVIFISSDRDQSSFDNFFRGMPWLALPFGDSRKASLSRKFKVSGIPQLVAIGSSGRTVTRDARDLVALHGAEAYPFTEERIKEIEAGQEDMARGWPEKVKLDGTHEHELVLTRRRIYNCNGCRCEGHVWSYYCDECDFDLHPKCALDLDEKRSKEKRGQE